MLIHNHLAAANDGSVLTIHWEPNFHETKLAGMQLPKKIGGHEFLSSHLSTGGMEFQPRRRSAL